MWHCSSHLRGPAPSESSEGRRPRVAGHSQDPDSHGLAMWTQSLGRPRPRVALVQVGCDLERKGKQESFFTDARGTGCCPHQHSHQHPHPRLQQAPPHPSHPPRPRLCRRQYAARCSRATFPAGAGWGIATGSRRPWARVCRVTSYRYVQNNVCVSAFASFVLKVSGGRTRYPSWVSSETPRGCPGVQRWLDDLVGIVQIAVRARRKHFLVLCGVLLLLDAAPLLFALLPLLRDVPCRADGDGDGSRALEGVARNEVARA